MNPVIVIPSYWARDDEPTDVGEIGVYDHATPVDKPLPELETCLSSLDLCRGVLRVVILLVAPPSCEASARARVEGICRMHSNLNPLVIGREEGALVSRVVGELAPALQGEPVSLRGYGAIRNMGLAVAAVLGHDVVVFLDDDEVILDPDFLVDAVYGLGQKNRQGIPILAKTGYFLDRDDSPYADPSKPRWCDRHWSKRDEFNQAMHRALTGTRVSRASYICGGCFAVSAQAFTRVAFDPQITRGEDLDYLLNLRMNAIDVWFDNQWRVKHLPPAIPSRASRFLQDVYRWAYERKKLEVCNATIGLRRVTSEALSPYPGPWMTADVDRRALLTAIRRAIVGPERGAYLRIATRGRLEARAWAEGVARGYLQLQTFWPRIMVTLWDNKLLARRLLKMGTARLTWASVSQGDER